MGSPEQIGVAQTQFPAIQVPAAPPPVAPTPPATDQVPLPSSTDQSFVGDATADPAQSVILRNADTTELAADGTTILQGHVKILYKGYTLTCDRADIDMDARTVLFSGHVLMYTPNGQIVDGGPDGTLRLDLRHSTYEIDHTRTTLEPQATSIGLILPLFIYGGTITGRAGFIDARGSSFTTCDFFEPHYNFGAKEIYIIPGKHLVGKYVSFYRKGHRIFTIPYLYIPLNSNNTQNIFPQVGRTPDEGYFAKVAVGYALTDRLPGLLHIDEFQKKGLGLGFDQDYGTPYNLPRGNGTFSFYHLNDRSTGSDNITSSLTHQQQIGTVNLTLNSSLQENSYLQSQTHSQAISSQLNLTRDVGNLDTSLRTSLDLSDYGAGLSQTLNTDLNDVYQPTARERLQTELNYSQFLSPSFGGGASTSQRQLNSNLDYSQRGDKVDLEILGTSYTQIGSSSTSSNFFGGLERLPEVRLATDSVRLGSLLKSAFPAGRYDFSVGEFHEPSSVTRTERVHFGIDLGTTTKNIDSRNSFQYGGVFEQNLYGDTAEQYILSGNTGYRLKLGSRSDTTVNYVYLRPYGFTPFQFDFVGKTNTTSFNFNYQETHLVRLTAATAYDFNQDRSIDGFPATPWQNFSVQALITPSRTISFQATSVYDLNTDRPLDYTAIAQVAIPRGVQLYVASRYAPQQHRFSNINGTLDIPFLRDPNPKEDAGWRLQAIGSYNGFSNRFDYRGLSVTRSWHDYEASVTYEDDPLGLRPGGGTFTLNFRLKAFPATQPFSSGQFGQSLDPGIGQVY